MTTGISNEKKKKSINHIWNIISKGRNFVPTRTNFFISSAKENLKRAGVQNGSFRIAVSLQMTVI